MGNLEEELSYSITLALPSSQTGLSHVQAGWA